LARSVARQDEGVIRWNLNDRDPQRCRKASGKTRRRAQPRVAPWSNADEHGDESVSCCRIRKECRRPRDEWLMRHRRGSALVLSLGITIQATYRYAPFAK
jgi:hypothetical protein